MAKLCNSKTLNTNIPGNFPMKIAIMQPYAFPYIGYFQLINAVDKFVILDDVNYIMRGWINRNRILVNGTDFLFSIPIAKASQNKMICECELAKDKERGKLLATIKHSYKRAPFFKDCFEVVLSVLNTNEVNLSRWLTWQLKTICKYLEINTEIVDSSLLYNNRHLKGQDKIIDICIKENATIYLNSAGGTELYNSSDFKTNNIELHFLKSLPEEYHQFSAEFVPYLSIIDVMMFNSKQAIQNLLYKYELL